MFKYSFSKSIEITIYLQSIFSYCDLFLVYNINISKGMINKILKVHITPIAFHILLCKGSLYIFSNFYMLNKIPQNFHLIPYWTKYQWTFPTGKLCEFEIEGDIKCTVKMMLSDAVKITLMKMSKTNLVLNLLSKWGDEISTSVIYLFMSFL